MKVYKSKTQSMQNKKGHSKIYFLMNLLGAVFHILFYLHQNNYTACQLLGTRQNLFYSLGGFSLWKLCNKETIYLCLIYKYLSKIIIMCTMNLKTFRVRCSNCWCFQELPYIFHHWYKFCINRLMFTYVLVVEISNSLNHIYW